MRRSPRGRRLLAVGGPIAAILAIVATLIIVKVAAGAGGPKSGPTASAAAGDVIAEVTAVPASALDAVGVGSAQAMPTPVSGGALTSNGKPEVLYVGAEYCPYCATERWALAVALSRFGTLTGLGQTASSPSDVYPNTATLTFHGAEYTSRYLSFTAKEIQSNQVVNGRYATLDTLTPAEQAVMSKYDAPPYFQDSGAIPFIDIGGKYLVSGASFDPQLLQGKTHQQIAEALSDPTSPIAKGIDGTANMITAAICRITGGQPAAVSTSAGVHAAAAELTGEP